MNRSHQLFRGVLASAAAFAMAACATEGPTQVDLEPAFEITPGPLTVGVDVCKVANDAETTGDVFTFNTTANSPVLAGTTVTVVASVMSEAQPLTGTLDCELVWVRTNASFDDESEITITEVLPAGYHLDQISFTGTGAPGEVVPAAILNPAVPSVTFKPYGGMRVYFKNSFVEEPGGSEGCTPGYWKVEVHHDSWIPTGYATGDLVQNVFSGVNAAQQGTLLNALNFGGGPGVDGAEQILLRAAVASLLNASHPGVDFPRTAADVIADVSAALESNDRGTILALAAELDEDNNLGCTLN